MTTAKKVLAIAAAEIGYSRWNDPKHGTKYGRWYAKRTGHAWFGNSGVAYCNMFTTWVFAHAGVKEPAPGHFAYVPYTIDAYAKAGRKVSNYAAQPGDLVCFDWNHDGVADHIGIVELNHGSYLQTIEGNTSGGGVHRRTRAWNTIIAVLRPTYTDSTPEPNQKEKLDVDGWCGYETTYRWQEVEGTHTDGIISGQYPPNRWRLKGVPSAEYTPKAPGSQLVRKLQRDLKKQGLYPKRIDGLMGAWTVRGLQLKYGTRMDWKISGPSQLIKAIQRDLNNR